jgi:hypothetical protein
MPSIRLVISDDIILLPKQHSHTAVLFDRQTFALTQNKKELKNSLKRHFSRNQSTETELLFFLFQIQWDSLEIWDLVLESCSFPLVELAVEQLIHDTSDFITPIVKKYKFRSLGLDNQFVFELNQHLLLALQCVIAHGLYNVKTLHSAFHLACERGIWEFLELFSTVRDFDVNFVNNKKETGLIIFTRNVYWLNLFTFQEFTKFVETMFLTFPNLDYNAKDYKGHTAMSCISSHTKRTVLAELIQEREECRELKRITLWQNKVSRFLTKDVVAIIQQFLTHKTPYVVQKPLIPRSILEEKERVASFAEESEIEEEEIDVDDLMALEIEGLNQAAHWEGGDAEELEADEFVWQEEEEEREAEEEALEIEELLQAAHWEGGDAEELDAEEFVWQDEEEEEEEENAEMMSDNDPLHVIPAPPIPTLLRNKIKTRQILITEYFKTRKICILKPTMKKIRQTKITEWLEPELDYESCLSHSDSCQCASCATPYGVLMYV